MTSFEKTAPDLFSHVFQTCFRAACIWQQVPATASAGMPSLQLAMFRAAAQQEQQQFCEEWRAGVLRPRGLPDNSTYDRVASVSLGLDGVGRQNVPYWVLSRTDLVSSSIKAGAWEPEDTHAVLAQLHQFQEARQDGFRVALPCQWNGGPAACWQVCSVLRLISWTAPGAPSTFCCQLRALPVAAQICNSSSHAGTRPGCRTSCFPRHWCQHGLVWVERGSCGLQCVRV